MYEAVALKLLDTGISALSRRLSKWVGDAGQRPSANTKGAEEAVRRHLAVVERWASLISFRDMAGARPLTSNFVELDLNVHPARLRGTEPPDRTYRVSELLRLSGHLAVLGDPGAGKTTSLKKTAATLLNHLEQDSGSNPTIPLLVQFREFAPEDSLVDWIASLLGVRLTIPETNTGSGAKQLKRQLLAGLLDEAPVTVLLDGLDEAPAQGTEDIIQDLREFTLLCRSARFILTCRSGSYPYDMDHCQALELSPLSRQQIRVFAEKWLGRKQAKPFLQQIARSPYAGSEVRPLTLAHLCAVFMRSGRVPEQPKTVYRMVVRLLLEEWDAQRSVRRTSRYANFEADRKEEFLEALSFHLSTEGVRGRFSHSQLRKAYLAICDEFFLPKSEDIAVAREIESHAGLILESGREEYEYAHKSIQEYFTAQYILKLPAVPADPDVFWGHPNELALAVALSSRPAEYLSNVLTIFLQQCDSTEDGRGARTFVGPLFQRLVTEGVAFNPNYLLGLCILATLSEYLPRSHSRGLVIGPSILEFLRLPGVMESIQVFRDRTQTRPAGVGLVELYWDNPREFGERTLQVLEMLGFPEALTVDVRLLLLNAESLRQASTINGNYLIK